MMAQVGIVIFFLYKIYSAEAMRNSEPSIYSVKPGDTVLLNCTSPVGLKSTIWYKQRLRHAPLDGGLKFDDKQYSVRQSRFELQLIRDSYSLSVVNVTEDDQGMYFCGVSDENTMTFSSGTFVEVAGHPQLSISVDQSPVSGSVSPAKPATLQYTVLSKIQAADLQVLWFRASAGKSYPSIIYTHHSSSQQHKANSSLHSCVFTFSNNGLNNSHAYYCAVASCGRFLPYRAPVDFTRPTQTGVFYLWPALGVCVAVIFAQILVICTTTNCKHCSAPVAENTNNQDSTTVELIYAAKQLRTKSGNSLYSELEYFKV